jgi:peptide-methionine (S)-S-oxide reductase
MPNPPLIRSVLLAGFACALAAGPLLWEANTGRAEEAVRVVPPPLTDEASLGDGLQTTVFAGGCFWGVQGVFQHVKGVTKAVSGYAGGTVANPDYEQVSAGRTGHAESVQVTFDPRQVSYGTLLQIFFSVALDPTQVDRQGPDWGTQYRSALFVADAEQERVARTYIAQLDATRTYSRPIVTKVQIGQIFYPAEDYHQDYFELHPDQPYIAINDNPKVQGLKRLFPTYWQAHPITVHPLAAGSEVSGSGF